jgi:hypothetical protein
VVGLHLERHDDGDAQTVDETNDASRVGDNNEESLHFPHAVHLCKASLYEQTEYVILTYHRGTGCHLAKLCGEVCV